MPTPLTTPFGKAPLRLLVIGTDTDIGKTHVTTTIILGLRQRGRRVWIHKPIACGDWDGQSSADGRSLRAVAGDGQSLDLVCPRELAPACSPHLALRDAHQTFTAAEMLTAYDRCAEGDHDLIVEGAGGLLAPLTSADEDISTLAKARNLATVIVTRPHLGTLNHTRLTVEAARHRGLHLLGLVVNHHEPLDSGLAVSTAGTELARLCQLPILAEVPYADTAQPTEALALELSQAILRAIGDAAP